MAALSLCIDTITFNFSELQMYVNTCGIYSVQCSQFTLKTSLMKTCQIPMFDYYPHVQRGKGKP